MALTPLQKSVTSFAKDYGSIVAFILWDFTFTGKDLIVCCIFLMLPWWQSVNVLSVLFLLLLLLLLFPSFIIFFLVCVSALCLPRVSPSVYAVHDSIWVSVEELKWVGRLLNKMATGTTTSSSFPIIGHQRDEKAASCVSCYY